MKFILETINLSKSFEGLSALKDINISIEKESIISLIGPNGAGKTTFFNCITGIHKPDRGYLIFNDRKIDIKTTPPHKLAGYGIARTFQNIRLFPNMSLIENIMTGCSIKAKTSMFDITFNTKAFKREEEEIKNKSIQLLNFVDLSDKLYELAYGLSYGEQRRLEIARALATDPELLLLDEPAAGMNTVESEGLVELIRKIRSNGVTVFLIEHDMKVVMSLSDKIIVFNNGEKIAEDKPSKIQKNKYVIEAYLGEMKE